MCDPIEALECPDCAYNLGGLEYPIDDDYELINDDHWNAIKEDRR